MLPEDGSDEASLALLETILANGFAGFALIDRDLRYVRVSERLAEISGLPAEAHIGHTVEEILGPEYWHACKTIFDKALAGEATVESILPSTGDFGTGRRGYVSASYLPVRHENDSRGVVMVIRDTTEQVEADTRQRQQSAAFENMWDALIVTDMSGRILQCNAAFVRLSGFSHEEVLGQPVSMLHRPEDRERILPEVAASILQNGNWEGEILFLRKDGSEGVSHTRVVPLRDEGGNIVGLIGANRDITEYRKAEAALPAADQRYRFLADAMPQIVWTALPNGGVDYFNPRWYEYTGLTEQQSREWGWESVLHPDDLEPCRNAWAASIGTGEPYEVEYRLRRRDGLYRWHLGRGLPMRDGADAILQWVGTCTDIEDQKQTERQQRVFLREMLASVTEGKLRLCDSTADLPKPLPQVAEAVPLDSTQSLRVLRHLAQETAQAIGFSDIRWQHLITGTSEMAMNAIQHAGGGEARVCADVDCTVQIWVEDTGGGITVQNLPRATLERGYSGAGTLGHGFWLTLQTVDRLYLLTSPAGTTVVLEQDRVPSEPDWLK